MIARATSVQKSIITVVFSQWPVLYKPYWDILMRIVPKDTTTAGANKDSVGCRNEFLKVSGYR